MNTFEDQRDSLLLKIGQRANGSGAKNGTEACIAFKKLLLWYNYFRLHKETETANELLVGARAAMLETASYVTLGLGRAAIIAIRTEIDLFMSYTYFCDHPNEWQKLKKEGEGFMLRSGIFQYHEGTTSRFKERLAILEQAYQLNLITMYKVLSAHIHGQSALTAPKAGQMSDLVVSEDFANSLVLLQSKCTDATSNFLFAIYADHWASLPPEIVNDVLSKLSDSQRSVFFSERVKQR